MANKTIYGCVNRTTGVITFEGEACDSSDYTGCIETAGEHIGQVKVVISELNCDDTYYGCVNRTTGKFQLIIPDDCCACPCEENDVCSGCFAANHTPVYVEITFSGVIDCNTGQLSELNGTWCLIQSDSCPGLYDCNWINLDATGSEQFDQICYCLDAGEPESEVNVTKEGDGYWIASDLENGCAVSFSALISDCDSGYAAHSGSATIANPCA